MKEKQNLQLALEYIERANATLYDGLGMPFSVAGLRTIMRRSQEYIAAASTALEAALAEKGGSL